MIGANNQPHFTIPRKSSSATTSISTDLVTMSSPRADPMVDLQEEDTTIVVDPEMDLTDFEISA
jgi:hypothetical protein